VDLERDRDTTLSSILTDKKLHSKFEHYSAIGAKIAAPAALHPWVRQVRASGKGRFEKFTLDLSEHAL
jgi:hypothetical protein